MKCLFLLLLWACIFHTASAQQPRDSSSRVSGDSSVRTSRSPFSQLLGELVIRAAKPPVRQQPYGTTVNVGSSLLDKGSSALEVLQRSPGVIIDQRTSNITLNGKSGVTVMLDDKLMHMSGDQLLTLLGSMSADDIEKIELLTTPPSGYDAEGAAGVINIVLKKTRKKGTSGSLSLTGGYGWREKGSASARLAHNTEKISTYGSYSFSHARTIGTLIASGTESVPVLGGQTSFDYLGITHRVNDSHNASLGLDFRLNPKITTGASISYNNSGSSSVSTNQDMYTIFTDSVLHFSGTVTGHSRWTNTITSVYAEKKIRDGEKLNLGMDYLSYQNNAPTSVNSSFRDTSGHQTATDVDSLFGPRQKGFSGTSIRVGVARLDYTRALNRRMKLETGLKGNYTASSSSSGIESLVNGAWVASLGATDNIDMKEGIAAAYVSVNTRVTPSVSLVTGARYEYSRTRLTEGSTGTGIVDRRLGTLFPNLFLSKKFNDHAEGQLSYTRRITRPSYNDLASYIEYNDPISVFTGNPLLKPAITDNLKLGFNYRKYSASLLLSRDTDPIAEYQITNNPSGSLVYISPQNLSFQDNLTLQTNLPLKVNDWWDMNLGFTGGWRHYRIGYTPQPGQVTWFGWSTTFSESFRLPRNFLLEISGYYNSLSWYGNGSNAGYAVLNGGIKKELNNNKGNFQLSVSDLFSSEVYNGHLGIVTTDAYATNAHVRYKPESATFPIIKLSYTRSFGSGGTKKDQPDNGPKEETDRIR